MLVTSIAPSTATGALQPAAKELGLEGIMAKDGKSVYSAERTTRWLKMKTPIGAKRERKRRPR